MKKLFKGLTEAFKSAIAVGAVCMYIYYVGKQLCDFTGWCYKGVMSKIMKHSEINDNEEDE